MNKIKNDNGDWVVSIGAPNSLENLKCRRPEMLKDLSNYKESYNMSCFFHDKFSWIDANIYIDRCYPDVEDWEHPLIAEYLGVAFF